MNGLMRKSLLFLLLLLHSLSISGYDSLSTKVPFNQDHVKNQLLYAQPRNGFKLESELNALELSKSLETKLKNIRNYELGVPILQEMYDSMEFKPINDSEVVTQIARKIAKKLDPAIEIIHSICDFLTNDVHNDTSFLSLINPCPFDDSLVKVEHYYNEIYRNAGGVQFDILNDKNLIFHKYLLENIAKVDENEWVAKRQYFLSVADKANIENCNKVPEDEHLMSLFVSAVTGKRILLLIDIGNALSEDQMDLIKAVAKSVINLLSPTDKIVNVLGVADQVLSFTQSAAMSSCVNEHLAMLSMTSQIKRSVLEFVENLNRSQAQTNHSLGFKVAFDVLKELYKDESKKLPISFLYISRGLLSPLSEAKNVLQAISTGQRELPFPVVINTCAIVIDKRRIMYEIQFLQDITYQNYSKYSVSHSWTESVALFGGKLFLINKTKEDLNKLGVVLLAENYKYKENIPAGLTLHKPYFDPLSQESIISITKNCRGVFGIDFFLVDLIEDLIASTQIEFQYHFLVDFSGNALSHPLYPRANLMKEVFEPVDIQLLENRVGFEEIWSRMRHEVQGNGTLLLETREKFVYTWQQVSGLLIVCSVTNRTTRRVPVYLSGLKPTTAGQPQYQMNELTYHRFDLLPQTNLNVCQFFKQVVTFDNSALFLSAACFKSAARHFRNNLENSQEQFNSQMIQNLMAYLKDNTNLIANPGILPDVRNDVNALYHVMEYLKKKHLESGFRKYVIRRYAATMNGVLEMYPGSVLSADFDPTRRPWFKKALANKGKISITEPYLDVGGSGWIVTISYTLFEGKASSLHNEKDQPIVVVALDFTRGFFYKLILDASPLCTRNNIKCFIMDDKGYLVAHPNILEPVINNNRHPVEHILHKESQVANDMLNHKRFVRKISCHNYINGTTQRYYQFNTSLTDVITNWANVEKTKYQLVSIQGTNLFVGIINSSYDGGAFCPCSTVDRLCLNCQRMEQLECECPCECPLLDESCAKGNESLEVCQQPIEYVYNYKAPMVKGLVDVCPMVNCDMFSTQADCLPVIGCTWCQVNYDTETYLSQPFCAMTSTCYNGVFGSSRDAYGEGGELSNVAIDSLMNYNFLTPTYSSILPVIGVVIVLIVIVGFAMYCYKLNSDTGGFGEHLYADSVPDNCMMMPMARLDFFDDHGTEEDLGGNLNQSLLQNPPNNAMVAPNISSPYRIATNYRRPTYGDSSDHGYSTMTPHDDSEHFCLTKDEAGSRIKRLSMSDSASINTSASSPQNNQPYDASNGHNGTRKHMMSDQTGQMLKHKLSPHHIIAEVIVHRHMET